MPKSAGEDTEMVVVGAGLAGLSAAIHICDHGLDVKPPIASGGGWD